MSSKLARISRVIEEDASVAAISLAATVKELSGSSMLVTGAGGFLCSFLIDVMVALNNSVLSKPCSVIALDNFQSGLPERIQHLQSDKNISFVQHDMRYEFLPERSVDYIIHGASIASPPFYRKFPLETMDVNIGGTRHLLDLCQKGSRSMLYLSTSEIYGDPDPAFVPTPETYAGNVSCTGPRACYDESKRVAETLCTVYHRLHQLPVKIARPFNVYGPGQRIDDGRIIPDLMSAVIKKEPFVLFGDGQATRSFCYVSDVVRALILLLLSNANGESFNVGNDQEEITMGGVARLVSKIAAPTVIDVVFQVNADPLYLINNPQRRCPDLTKLKRLTGYSPEFSLEKGLSRTLESYRDLALENHAFKTS
jgi:dTDP-glucose 4,6-dehydratase/UDP-glucuronate decarboxylase